MIKLVNLNKAYRDKVVLKNLNLEINKGEIIGLLAPNAEGKSTLLKILGGQITFDSGQYFFNGEEFNYLTVFYKVLTATYNSIFIFTK